MNSITEGRISRANHHERQAEAHLAALDQVLPSPLLTVEDLARLAIRAQMAQAHATLAVSLRTAPGLS